MSQLKPFYRNEHATVYHGDCLAVLPELAENSIDSIVTDPPYSFSFMGREWDNYATPLAFQQWCQQWATECLRILKPGGHLLAFGGTRTYHRLACAIEDAGFEIRDSIAWLYGSGFPKSLDVSKAIDKAAGVEREVIGPGINHEAKVKHGGTWTGSVYAQDSYKGVDGPMITTPATDAAKQWEGWGTALKPAHESIIVARKPFKGSVAANVLEHGTGALNIDVTRVSTSDNLGGGANKGMTSYTRHEGFARPWMDDDEARDAAAARSCENTARAESLGRWPPNVVIDQHTAAGIDAQSGITKDGFHVGRNRNADASTNEIYSARRNDCRDIGYGGEGGASRFFPTFKYTSKAATAERPNADGETHPTVKPLDLMRWLCRLVTPPHGIVLDPFAGSGTTAEAAIHEHMQCITIEREESYLPIIVARLHKPMQIGFDFDT